MGDTSSVRRNQLKYINSVGSIYVIHFDSLNLHYSWEVMGHIGSHAHNS